MKACPQHHSNTMSHRETSQPPPPPTNVIWRLILVDKIDMWRFPNSYRNREINMKYSLLQHNSAENEV